MIAKTVAFFVFAPVLLLLAHVQPAMAQVERPACTCKLTVQGTSQCGVPNEVAKKPPEVGAPYERQFKIREFFIPELAAQLTRGTPGANLSYCPPFKKDDPKVKNREELERLIANPPLYRISSPEDCIKFSGTDVVPFRWEKNPPYDGFYAIGVGSCITTYSKDAAVPLSTKPANYQGPLPDCAFYNIGCRNTNQLLQLLVNVGNFIFAGIGAWALLAFVYGGVMMIISMGNAEQFKKGRDALVAAVVGLVISLSAYFIINFVLDALQVSPEFRPPDTAATSVSEGDAAQP